MKCLNPILVVNPRYRTDLRKAIYASDKYPDDYWLYVPCGSCFACNKSRAAQWRTRLIHEVRYTKYSSCNWVTFTISPKYYAQFKDSPGTLIRRFLERYRQVFGKSLRHWFITELGEERDRLHFHGFVFNLGCSYAKLRSLWMYGFVWVSYCSEKRIGYACKYACKQVPGVDFRPQVFTSPAIGKSYTEHACWLAYHHSAPDGDGLRMYLCNNGYYATMPRYYRDKIFTEKELYNHRKYLEAHPPRFSVSFGKLKFSDPVKAREYRDWFYQETLSIGTSRKPRYVSDTLISLKHAHFPIS